MLTKDVCKKCRIKHSPLGAWTGLDESIWMQDCIRCPGAGWTFSIDATPPKGCFYKFEHGVAEAHKR